MQQDFAKENILFISQNIKNIRIKNNLTRTELAKNLSLSISTITRWENQQAIPKAKNLIKFAKYFNVKLSNILGL